MQKVQDMPGYHLRDIDKGTYGELSKIREEVEEALEAEEQRNKLMVLQELSDVIGAIRGYLDAHFKDSIGLHDLIAMAGATDRAFKSGRRK